LRRHLAEVPYSDPLFQLERWEVEQPDVIFMMWVVNKT
jgi:hypothetical protein